MSQPTLPKWFVKGRSYKDERECLKRIKLDKVLELR